MTGGDRDPERWRRVEEVFDRAIELGPAERAAFLEAEIDDPALAREVEALLDAAVRPGPLDAPVGDFAQTLTREAADAAGRARPWDGEVIGAWRIKASLGGGGMGRVFLAERHDGDFDQVAALKLLRWELASDAMVERFKNERRILARLEHPGIARLIDGGVTEEGLPYLVMEHVEGEPIDRYCRQRELAVSERLGLALQVCDAVEAAHRRLIVHRDLKPSNVLVTPEGKVKLLDFGVAKLLETESEPALTRTHLAPATPGYAAPEQLTGGEVTTATDVYSLGVLLYLLLADERPVDVASSSPTAVALAVLDHEPEPPSRRAQARHAPAVRGDLDNITLTALRKEPERRYPSVDRLAADVRRYLGGRPVDATPDTLGYRFRKFASRNRAGLAAAGLVVVAILAGLAATAWQARKAQREALKATRVAGFLSSLLASANPYDRVAGTRSLEDVLHLAAERLDTELLDEPEVRADLLTQIGIGHHYLLRQDERASELLAEAERVLTPHGDSEELAEVWMQQAALAYARSDYPTQAELLSRARAFFEKSAGPRSESVARTLVHLVTAFKGENRPEDAKAVGRQALEILRGLPEPPELIIAQCLSFMAGIEDTLGDPEGAIEIKMQALEAFERAGGEDDPDAITLRNNLGFSLNKLGRYAEAEKAYRRAIELHERRFGPDHPAITGALTNLARVFIDTGRFQEAVPFAERAVAAGSGLPQTNFQRIAAEINLATAQLETGSVEQAEAGYRAARDRFVEMLGTDHPAVLRANSLLADAVRLSGKPHEAERLYRSALDSRNGGLDETQVGLARVLSDTAGFDEARALLDQALGSRLQRLDEGHWRVLEIRAESDLLELRAAQGRAGASRRQGRWADALSAVVGRDNWRARRLRALL